jgi:hypothetical protein
MPLVDLIIRSKNGDITATLFGADIPPQDAITKLGDDITLGFKHEEVQRGFVETHFFLQLALSFPLSIASSVAARFIYDRLNPLLSKGDTVTLGNDSIVIERLDELQLKLADKLDQIRNQSGDVNG